MVLILLVVSLMLFILLLAPPSFELKSITISWHAEWDLWTILTAVGTIGATAVAVWLALLGLRKDRDAVARVVAAWITDDYEPREDGSSYERVVRVHIANQSTEPVFDARLNVVFGRDQTPLGPLSAPTPISVVPPRGELIYDITIPLLAHRNSWNPRATLYFTDPKDRRWLRNADGKLFDVSKEKARWSAPEAIPDERQLGDLSTPMNPMMVAVAFLAGVRDPQFDLEKLQVVLAPEAPGWADAEWAHIGSDLARYQPTSMVDYPAPRIARIKLSGNVELEGRSVEGEGLELEDFIFMTLTFAPDRGWRVFGVGASVRPDEILFEEGSLLEDSTPSPTAGEGSIHD
ncbi:hypothetical protein E3T27_06255 [Cryobacterium lyxosi]|uniref:Uncharacterized protein n=1 Tax=Cryobacterium lyxosi TaxID=1259228 RepID=A0A4R8ZGL3_9MICO|nr:hypothetical protein E3T27_06255 [Cryobacterium lyxosi]